MWKDVEKMEKIGKRISSEQKEAAELLKHPTI